jgi:hypothetical protein
METQSLIELRRLDAIEGPSDTSAHGDFTIVLKQPVTLNEGDSVVLNRSFVDTRGQISGTIDLPEGVQVTAKYIVWIQNWVVDASHNFMTNRPQLQEPDPTARPGGTSDTGTIQRLDGYGPFLNPGIFVACKAPTLTPNTTSDQAQLIALGVTALKEINVPGTYINFTISSNPNNPAEQTKTGKLWAQPIGEDKVQFIPCSFLIGRMDKNFSYVTLTDDPPIVEFQDIDDRDWNESDFISTAYNADGGKFVPVEYDLTFSIPPGSYTPDDLAKRITALLSVDKTAVLSTATGSAPLLQTSQSCDAFVQVWDDSGIPDLLGLDSYGVNLISVLNTNPIYIGASEAALEFDADSNVFKFTYLHTPILDADGNESTIILDFNNHLNSSANVQKPAPQWQATAHSGICFTQLEPASFWQDTLGFDLSTIVLDNNWEYRTQDVGGCISLASTPKFFPKFGVNATDAFEGAASLLTNSTAGGSPVPNFYNVDTPRKQFINTSLTNAISAGPLPPAPTDTSHYLVEVSGVPMSQMITSKTQTFSLAGVVGRYQTRGSFTEGGGGDGAPTQILGNSVLLSKLNVRILNPDRTPVTDMGPLSSVYLTVTRQVQLPPPLPPVLAAQPPGLLPNPLQPDEDEPPPKKAK